jgi:UDP-hydrolysing UDP-N-acetyl-D-glucosamine 2-epimerase
MRRVAVLTSGRQDFGILRSTCRALAADARFELQLIVTGMHLEHGSTVDEDLPARRLDITRADAAAGAAAMLELLPPLLRELQPEALMLVGDRSETAAAALAATLARVPLIHLHGGEESEGAIDNVLRHAITKMSHLHLVSNEEHARRVRQMGEENVHVVGAPGLDNLFRTDLPDRAELEQHLGIALAAPLVAVTFHPTTLGGAPEDEVAALIAAMRAVPATYVVTLPNNDDGARAIREALLALARTQPSVVAVQALGERRYFGLLKLADAVLGNSSSAIIEAPAVGLPAVNVGDRQRGRARGANVIDVACDGDAIAAALRRALDPRFRESLAGAPSPFGDGRSAARIVELLSSWQPPRPPRKRFADGGAA